MGEVYEALDPRLQRTVALKVLRCCGGEDGAGALLREARAASALRHPAIAVIYEAGEADDDGSPTAYIAMEYVAGPTLAEFARTGGAATADLVGIVVQVAEALAEAHARGIVHRDVKPGNILVAEGRRAKVVDFGLALRSPTDTDETVDVGGTTGAAGTTGTTGTTGPGGLAGTVAYVSPEQAVGSPVDGRADVFSLGAVLYEVLTGRRAFPGETVGAVLAAVLRDDPPAPESVNAAVTPELSRIVRKMLEKSREKRYQTMKDAALDLEAARAALAGGKGDPARAERPPAVAVVDFLNVTRRPEDDWIGLGIAETLAADLKRAVPLPMIGRDRVHEAVRNLAAERPGEADEKRATEVARRVGARWLVAGAFQRVGNGLRVTARVEDVESGLLARSVKADGNVDGIFDLQDRVVAELIAGMHAISGVGSERAGGAGDAGDAGDVGDAHEETRVVGAFEAHAKGLINLRAATPEALDRATVLFLRAVELDPGWAGAWTSLGWALADKADYVGAAELAEKALAHFGRAIALSPTSTEAWRGRASAFLTLCRDDEALEAARRALELSPEDPASLSAIARVLFIGKAEFGEAAAAYDRALAANPQGGWMALQMSHALALAGDLDAAGRAARKAIELQEAFLSGKAGLLIVGSYIRLAHVLALMGRHAEALGELRREEDFLNRVGHSLRPRTLIEVNTRTGSSLLHLGREEEARVRLTEAVAGFEERLRMGADEPFSRYYAAVALELLGRRPEALAALEGATRTSPASGTTRGSRAFSRASRADRRCPAPVSITGRGQDQAPILRPNRCRQQKGGVARRASLQGRA